MSAADPSYWQTAGLVAIGAGVASVVGGAWAVVAYLNGKRLEYKKVFNDSQLEIVLLAAQTAGDLVGLADPAAWEDAKGRFWELYWGRLVIFEDNGVIDKMVSLGKAIEQGSFEERRKLEGTVYDLSLALRDFLKTKNEDEWRISIDTPTRRKLLDA